MAWNPPQSVPRIPNGPRMTWAGQRWRKTSTSSRLTTRPTRLSTLQSTRLSVLWPWTQPWTQPKAWVRGQRKSAWTSMRAKTPAQKPLGFASQTLRASRSWSTMLELCSWRLPLASLPLLDLEAPPHEQPRWSPSYLVFLAFPPLTT